jgi:metal-responsive CopG/Arc/MetJ family transcriptional regulator
MSSDLNEPYDKISVNLPHSLLTKIDAAAKADTRNRTSWLIHTLKKILEEMPEADTKHSPISLVDEDPTEYKVTKRNQKP